MEESYSWIFLMPVPSFPLLRVQGEGEREPVVLSDTVDSDLLLSLH